MKYKKGLSFLGVGLAYIILQELYDLSKTVVVDTVTTIWESKPLLLVEILALGIMAVGVILIIQEHKNKKENKTSPPERTVQDSSVESQMRTTRKIDNILNHQPIRHNKEFSCGCWAKDTDMVKLCTMHRQQYLFGMNYEPPEGCYISDNYSL